MPGGRRHAAPAACCVADRAPLPGLPCSWPPAASAAAITRPRRRAQGRRPRRARVDARVPERDDALVRCRARCALRRDGSGSGRGTVATSRTPAPQHQDLPAPRPWPWLLTPARRARTSSPPSVRTFDGFFVAFPEQDPTMNTFRCWRWNLAANQRRDVGEPSLIAAWRGRSRPPTRSNPRTRLRARPGQRRRWRSPWPRPTPTCTPRPAASAAAPTRHACVGAAPARGQTLVHTAQGTRARAVPLFVMQGDADTSIPHAKEGIVQQFLWAANLADGDPLARCPTQLHRGPDRRRWQVLRSRPLRPNRAGARSSRAAWLVRPGRLLVRRPCRASPTPWPHHQRRLLGLLLRPPAQRPISARTSCRGCVLDACRLPRRRRVREPLMSARPAACRLNARPTRQGPESAADARPCLPTAPAATPDRRSRGIRGLRGAAGRGRRAQAPR